ncbi:hypothetical protein [Halomonas alimentaria]|uniref:Uncharacterized protein n=1 Tax=Halomonas alimentaria TaxID=147248 RepID=A0A7X4W2P2_9GAMM|nr:hypothetical protein [Halomonas alimentaria]NAW33295.1 hypothetical protein [Halomonas alimentaria]
MAQDEERERPLWEVVPLEERELPRASQASQARRRWQALGRWLTLGSEAGEEPARDEAQLRRLPRVRLANLAPPIDWQPGARALAHYLAEAGESAGPVTLLVGAPADGHAELVEAWARLNGARLLPEPAAAALLAGEMPWSPAPSAHAWAVPRLERGFLRQATSLAGLRNFLEAALTGRLGRGVIGCDSWTWAYLQHALALPESAAVTLQAFDGARLTRYLAATTRAAAARTAGEPPAILAVGSGEPVLADGDEASTSRELRELAAHCHGQLGLAWHYWRARLCDETPEGEAPDTLWLAESLDEATLPGEVGEESVLLLHTLLLHGGLDEALLPEVLPFSHARALSGLRQLQRRGVVSCDAGRWRVAPLGYMSVRRLLEERTYLVDAL